MKLRSNKKVYERISNIMDTIRERRVIFYVKRTNCDRLARHFLTILTKSSRHSLIWLRRSAEIWKWWGWLKKMPWAEVFSENTWKSLEEREKREQQAWCGRIREEQNIVSAWKLPWWEKKKKSRGNFSWRIVYRYPKLENLKRRSRIMTDSMT